MGNKSKAKGTLTFAIVSAAILSLGGCFKNNFETINPLELSSTRVSPAGSDPVGFDRLSVPGYAANTFILQGRCLVSQAVTVRVQDGVESSPTCVAGAFQVSLTMSGADGAKVIIISQIDASGRVWQDSVTIIKDTIAPVIVMAEVKKTAVGVQISGTCQGSDPMTFGGDILTATAISCSNNTFQTTVSLKAGEGSKNLEIAQTDPAGNRGVAQRVYIVDSTVPVVTIAQPLANSQFEDAIQLRGACESGIEVVASGNGLVAQSVAPCLNSAYTLNANLSAGLGSKSVVVSQTDATQNRGEASITLVRIVATGTAPVIAVLQPAMNTIAKTGVVVSGTCTTGLTVKISGAVSALSTTSCTTGTFTASVDFSVGDGNKTITLTQTNLQNVSGSVSRTFVKDSLPPVISIATPTVNSFTNASTVSVSGMCESGITVVLYGTGTMGTASANCTNGLFQGQVSLTAGDGAKEIRVGQADLAQNSVSAVVNVQRDSVAPIVKIVEPAANTMAASGLTLRGTCESALVVKATGTGIASAAQATCAAGSFALDVIFSAGDGVKTVTVTQADGAANTGTDARSFVKGTLPVYDGAQLYAQHCSICHNSLATSTKLDRTSAQILSARTSVPAMSGNPGIAALTTQQIDAIALALKTTTSDPVANPFFCQATAQPPAHRLQRLAKSEYLNTLRDLFAGVVGLSELSTEIAFFPEELNQDNPFDRGADSMSFGLVQAHNKISAKIAALATATDAKMNLVFSETCFTATTVTDVCVTSFIDRFGVKAYRRPLKVAEKTPLLAAYKLGATRAESSAFILRALLMSPNFLYHLEYEGTPVDATLSALNLNPYELASRLSYLIVNTAPDNELLATAANGSILTAATYEAQMRRLLALPAARTSFRRFFYSWFGLDRMRDAVYSTAFKSGIDTTNINALALEEALLFSDHVVFEGKKLGGLLTDNTAFIKSPAIAQIYGVNMPAAADGRVTLPAGERSGMLTRVARTLAGNDTTSPILRGVAVRRALLCDTIAAPDPSTLPVGSLTPPPEDPLLSTRRRFEIKTSAPVCMSCHSQINPIGYSLENYDALGRFRTVERILSPTGSIIAQHPIDAVATVNLSQPPDPTVNGGLQLSSEIAASQKFPACFSKRWFQFSLRRTPTPLDNCALGSTYDVLKNPNATLLDAIKSTIVNPEFKMRRMK